MIRAAFSKRFDCEKPEARVVGACRASIESLVERDRKFVTTRPPGILSLRGTVSLFLFNLLHYWMSAISKWRRCSEVVDSFGIQGNTVNA